MFRSHVLIALRRLRRQWGYTSINVFGLAVGLACCLLIGLFVQRELSYDRFHRDADRIVSVGAARPFGGEVNPTLATPLPLARALEESVPGVERATTTTWSGAEMRVDRPGTDRVDRREVLFADSAFFSLFTYPLTRGDTATALDRPGQVVITETMARDYFGAEDPIGQQLGIDRHDSLQVYTVVGLLASVPENSYFRFEAVASLGSIVSPEDAEEWGMSSYTTFARLAPGATAATVEAALPALVRTRIGPDDPTTYFLTPMTGLYLSALTEDAGFKGSSRYLLIFGSAALFILLVALINYMNLATARAAQRAREVGVRKTVGARRSQLAGQFLAEALIVTAAAFALGVGLTQGALPLFNHVFETALSLRGALTPGGVAVALATVLVVGLGAGSYPAFYLSGFRPTRLFRDEAGGRGGAARLRRGLVVTQFAVTVVLLIATLVVYRQLRYVQAQSLGFNSTQVLAVDFESEALGRQADAIKAAVLSSPDVVSASAASGRPGGFNVQYGINPTPDTPGREMGVYVVRADADYVATLGLELAAGRDVDPALASDRTTALLINEAAAAELGLDNPVGHTLPGIEPETNQIVGVLKDFHFASLRSRVEPALIRIEEPGLPWSQYDQLLIRFRPEAAARVVAHAQRVLDRFGAEQVPEPHFLDSDFAAMYAADRRLGHVFSVFAAVAVLIACLGLLGLAAFAAEQRTKEIGVRKVLGAGVPHLVALLSRDFLVLVAIAFVVAAPVAYLAMDRWLEGFAYRVDVGFGTFALAGLAALALALGTVSAQAFRAATADPVKALRSE